MNASTIQPVADDTAANPEWMKVPTAVKNFGIGRSVLYELIASNQIKSVCLRKRGCTRGIRLINADSVRAMLDAAATSAN